MKSFNACHERPSIMKKCFIIMPFASKHDEVYQAYQEACSKTNHECERADTSNTSRSIMADVVQKILDADIIIADLSDLNSNVLYEMGIAHACMSKVLLTCETATLNEKLPFDIAAYRIRTYSRTKQGIQSLIGNIIDSLSHGSPDAYSSPYHDALAKFSTRSDPGTFVQNTWRVAFENLNGALLDTMKQYERLEAEILRRALFVKDQTELLRFARSEYRKIEYPNVQNAKKLEQMPYDITITVPDPARKFLFHPSKEGLDVESGHPFHVFFERPDRVIYWQNRYSSERLDELDLLIPRRNVRLTRLACRHVSVANAYIIIESHINFIHTLPFKKDDMP